MFDPVVVDLLNSQMQFEKNQINAEEKLIENNKRKVDALNKEREELESRKRILAKEKTMQERKYKLVINLLHNNLQNTIDRIHSCLEELDECSGGLHRMRDDIYDHEQNILAITQITSEDEST